MTLDEAVAEIERLLGETELRRQSSKKPFVKAMLKTKVEGLAAALDVLKRVEPEECTRSHGQHCVRHGEYRCETCNEE